MRQVAISEDTFRKLIELKNHWSFQHRSVTNPQVQKIIEDLKRELFGSDEETMRKKSTEELRTASERFARAYKELLFSGYDFEPEYTLDEHIRKMIEVINQDEELPVPMF